MNPAEYAQKLAAFFQSELKPNSVVYHDWVPGEAFYRFKVVTGSDHLTLVRFTGRDVAYIGMDECRWIERFKAKLAPTLKRA